MTIKQSFEKKYNIYKNIKKKKYFVIKNNYFIYFYIKKKLIKKKYIIIKNMENKEKDNKMGSESTVKSWLKNYFLDYFLSNPKLHITINHSRIYNTYLWVNII